MSVLHVVLILLIMTWAGTLGAYFFKKGTKKINGVIQFLTCMDIYIGGAFYITGAVTNIILLKYIPYTILYPMTSLTYVWTMVFSSFVLKEKISLCKLLALCFIVSGIVVINL